MVHSKPRYLPATAMLDFVQDCVQRTSIFFCVTKTWWVEGRESKGLQWEKRKYGNGGCIVTETRESPTSSPLSIRIYATIRSCCSSFLDRMPRGACLCSLTREHVTLETSVWFIKIFSVRWLFLIAKHLIIRTLKRLFNRNILSFGIKPWYIFTINGRHRFKNRRMITRWLKARPSSRRLVNCQKR